MICGLSWYYSSLEFDDLCFVMVLFEPGIWWLVFCHGIIRTWNLVTCVLSWYYPYLEFGDFRFTVRDLHG